MKIGCQIGVWKDDGNTLLDAARTMAAEGIEGLEAFVQHVQPHYGKEEEARALLTDYGIELSGAYFGSEKFISPDDEESVVSEAAAAAQSLGELGEPFLILNGGVSKQQKPEGFSDADFRQLGQTMNRIGEAVQAHGVTACVHPHARCMVEAPDDLDRLLEYLDPSLVGLCLHAAHQVLIGADPYVMYEKHASLVRYMHIGAIGAGEKGALFGEGILDQKRLMNCLLDVGYDGWLIIESGKEGVSSKEYVLHATEYIRNELLA